MHHIGVLAFGSLIGRPGAELDDATARRIPQVFTPFHVEFARTSDNRGGAPTLVPVNAGGSQVLATVLVMHDWVTLEEARTRLYRREINKENSDKLYVHRERPGPNQVQIPALSQIADVETVIYTSIGDTIQPEDRNADHLADLAIKSARRAPLGRDGITYLADAIDSGIVTPLSRDYEAAILMHTGALTLAEALETARQRER